MAPGIERVKTGVFGLDDLLEGGFPKGRTILLSGGPGTGKTIMGIQYVYKGIVDYGEPAVYATIDEQPSHIREDMLRFGWDLEKLESQNKLAMIDIGSARIGLPSEETHSIPNLDFSIDRMINKITKTAQEIGAKRLVIDSVSSLGAQIGEEKEIRKAIMKLSYLLPKTSVTTVL